MQQDGFFALLPNLKHLDIGRTHHNFFIKEITRSNDTWKSLESLKIQIPYSEETKSTAEFIGLLATCGKLHTLELFKGNYPAPAKFEAKDFDKLHQNLQYLKSFKACITLDMDVAPSQHISINRTPALTLTTLDLYTCKWSDFGMYYFAHKYPNLNTMRWSTLGTCSRTVSPNNMQQYSAIFDFTTKVLQRLETFEFVTVHVPGSHHSDFWEFLSSLRAPIKNLKYKISISEGRWSTITALSKKLIELFSETLETLSVNNNAPYKSMYKPQLKISSCCLFLVDLKLRCCGMSIGLQNLFDSCVALKRLRIYNAELSCFSRTRNQGQDLKGQKHQEQKHGLRILELHRISTSRKVFSYLSFRCRRLEYMKLNSTYIKGTISGDSQSFLLDMSYTSFKLLHLVDVRFTIFNDQANENCIISMLLLSQQNGLSSTDKNKNDVDPNSTTVPCPSQSFTWFRFFRASYEEEYILWLIKRQDQGDLTPVEYFQMFHFENCPLAWKTSRLLNKNTDIDTTEHLFSKCYIELRCGSIEQYTILNSGPKNNDFWESLYDLYKNK
ncbi:hypothetical protein F4703DRAFT_1881134 [Phycomyces blakesleeanus]